METGKKGLRYIGAYINSFLDNTVKKVFFALATIVVELIAAYMVAIFDVGLLNWDISIGGMWNAYQEPGATYPWDVLLVLTICILFTDVLIIWRNGTPPGGRNFKLSKSDVYGSGREISKQELEIVADVTDKDSTKETILGQLDKTGKRVIAKKPGGMKPNDNILVFAPPGSGKSFSFVRPFIAQAIMRRHSLVVTDTKGEVYATTAEYARYMGYRVLRLDLKDPSHSDGWSVLKELRHDDVRAQIFAKIVMASSGNLKDNFVAPQESLLKACCLYQERHPGLADSQRTFYNAFAMLLQGAENLDATITAAFANYGECMQVVSDAYGTFLHGSPNLRGNIITGLANRLQILASPPVREMTSTDEIDFESIGKEPTILYISMSDQHDTMKFLANLAFSYAIMDLADLADSRPTQKLEVPVDFVLEEFANLGQVPAITRYLSTLRSRGITLNLIVQNMAQFDELYEESTKKIIMSDCATWMCLGCNDEDTARLMEWRCGETTVKVKTEQHDAMEPPFKLTHRNSTGDGRRNLYTSNEVMELQAQEDVLLIWQSKKVLMAKSFPISMHHDFIAGKMPEISSITLIPLANKKAKALFRQWEEDRIQSFNTWLTGGDPLADFDGLKTPGATSTVRPEIIPLHTLERMALAAADGKEYDATDDPDIRLHQEERAKNIKQNKKAKQRKKQKEPEVWNLDGVIFENVSQPDTPKEPMNDLVPPANESAEEVPDAMPELVLPQMPTVAEPVVEPEPVMEPEPQNAVPQHTAPATQTSPKLNRPKSYAESKIAPPMESLFFGSDVATPKNKQKDLKKTALEGPHASLPDK